MRGRTRENAVSAQRLAALGITAESWGADIASGRLPGFVLMAHERLVGYCFGDRDTGEVVVLALLPEAEARGLGRRLLGRVVDELRASGHPATRSHGFYRHLGWRSTGTFDAACDEVLELTLPAGASAKETAR